MVSFFWGELLAHPAAINIDLNTCAHACCYCYANARRTARRTNLNAVRRLCSGEMGGIMGQVWRMGYPVTLCNNTDPLSENNAREALAIVRMINREGRPLYIMTKGGRREDEDELLRLLADNGHAMLYVSISAATDEIAAKTEPGAVPISARLDLLRRAHEMGIGTEVGFNPFYPGWWPEKTHGEMQDRLLGMGLRTWFYNKLHLSRFQADDPRCTAVLTADEIKGIRARNAFDDVFCGAILDALNKGADVYEMGLPSGRTNYFENILKALGKAMPATGEFIVAAIRKWRAQAVAWEERKPMEFHYEDFERVILEGREDLLDLEGRYAEFFLLRDIAAFSTPRVKRIRTFREFLKEAWNNPRIKCFSPRANVAFGVREEPDANGDAVLYIDGERHEGKGV